MKYPDEQYKKLIFGLKAVIKYFDIADKNDAMAYSDTLHFKVFVNYNYSDDNLNVKFVDGKRLLPIDPDYKLYPDGCHDAHIQTALKRAIEEIYG